MSGIKCIYSIVYWLVLLLHVHGTAKIHVHHVGCLVGCHGGKDHDFQKHVRLTAILIYKIQGLIVYC